MNTTEPTHHWMGRREFRGVYHARNPWLGGPTSFPTCGSSASFGRHQRLARAPPP